MVDMAKCGKSGLTGGIMEDRGGRQAPKDLGLPGQGAGTEQWGA